MLIHAGAGGVGHFAVQLANQLGATVAATASVKNHEFIMSLGADRAIDYTSQKFEKLLTDIDFVLDTVGGETLERSIGVVKKDGTIVTIIPPLAENVQEQARASGIILTLLIGQGSQQGMEELAGLLRTGAIKAHVSAVYPFSAMADAHTAIESRRTVGKIVVKL